MALDEGKGTQPEVRDMAVQCTVFDRDGRARRKLVMPLERLLAGFGGDLLPQRETE